MDNESEKVIHLGNEYIGDREGWRYTGYVALGACGRLGNFTYEESEVTCPGCKEWLRRYTLRLLRGHNDVHFGHER